MSRTDRLLADLERGFEALEAGKLDTAATIVERCRRIDRKNPDVIALSAAVADASGDGEAALVQYRALMELRPDDPMPRICVARLELHDLADPDAALDTVEAAFDFIDEEEDLIEAIYLKAEALVARGEPAPAREALAELSTSVIDDAELAFDLAELALSADDAAGARRWLEAALKTARSGGGDEHDGPDPSMAADALHLLGRIHELDNDREAMINAWQQVRKLDLAAPPGPLAISEDEVERITLATLAELPANIRQHLEKVPILIDDIPSEDIVGEGWDPRLLGLFTGVPLPDDGHLSTPSITNILLFRRNLERSCADEQQLADEIRITVLHETAHYFGLDDDDLEALGLD